MIIIDVLGFEPYIPSTVIGLIGVIAAYIFAYSRIKANNKLKKIELANKKDRPKIVAMELNEAGIEYDPDKLTSEQQYILISKTLSNKKFYSLLKVITTLIAAIALIIIVFVLNKNVPNPIPNKNTFSFSSGNSAFDSLVINTLRSDGYAYNAFDQYYNIKIGTESPELKARVISSSRRDFYIEETQIQLSVNDSQASDLGILVPGTDLQESEEDARKVHKENYAITLAENSDLIIREIKNKAPYEH